MDDLKAVEHFLEQLNRAEVYMRLLQTENRRFPMGEILKAHEINTIVEYTLVDVMREAEDTDPPRLNSLRLRQSQLQEWWSCYFALKRAIVRLPEAHFSDSWKVDFSIAINIFAENFSYTIGGNISERFAVDSTIKRPLNDKLKSEAENSLREMTVYRRRAQAVSDLLRYASIAPGDTNPPPPPNSYLDVSLDANQLTIGRFRRLETIDLSRNKPQFEIMVLLAERRGGFVGTDEFEEAIPNAKVNLASRLRQEINNLRPKIAQIGLAIENRRGVGYQLLDELDERVTKRKGEEV